MKKKSLLWSLAATATAAAAITIYYVRKRNAEAHNFHGRKNRRNLRPAFARAKGISSGEYTL